MNKVDIALGLKDRLPDASNDELAQLTELASCYVPGVYQSLTLLTVHVQVVRLCSLRRAEQAAQAIKEVLNPSAVLATPVGRQEELLALLGGARDKLIDLRRLESSYGDHGSDWDKELDYLIEAIEQVTD